MHCDDPRGVWRDILTRLADRLGHDIEDVQASLAGLLQSLFQDHGVNTADLDVHLQSSDALSGTCDLEVHVTVMVLGTRNVGKDRIPVPFHHEAHRDTGDRLLDRHAGVHQAENAAAYRRHRRRTVRFCDLGDNSDRIREIGFIRQC